MRRPQSPAPSEPASYVRCDAAVPCIEIGVRLKPTISAARTVAETIGARQVVVIGFDAAGKYAVISYGVTANECRDVTRLCDAIAAGLDEGSLPGPEVNRS